MKCTNCGYEHNEDYCPACGKSKTTTVINFEELEKEERQLAINKKIAIISCIVFACFIIGCITIKFIGEGFDKSIKVTTNEKIEPYGTLGNYFVEIVSATTTLNYSNEPSIIIYFSYTNNSYEAQSFLLAFDYKIYQDGIECDSTIPGYDNSINIDTDKYRLDIKPGITTEIPMMFTLHNKLSDVVVEVAERNPRYYNPYDIVRLTITLK